MSRESAFNLGGGDRPMGLIARCVDNIPSKFVKRPVWLSVRVVDMVALHTQSPRGARFVGLLEQRARQKPVVCCLAVFDCLRLALFLPSEQYFHYSDEKCICSAEMRRYKSRSLGVQAHIKSAIAEKNCYPLVTGYRLYV